MSGVSLRSAAASQHPRNKPICSASKVSGRISSRATASQSPSTASTFVCIKGEHLGLIGEFGSGKSVTALSIMRLIREPPGRIVAGRDPLRGAGSADPRPESMRRLRGNRISMIFQDPLNHLDPVMRVGDWIAEALTLHKGMGRSGGDGRGRSCSQGSEGGVT